MAAKKIQRKTKRFEYTRADVSKRLSDTIRRLEEASVYDMTPAVIADFFMNLTEDLENVVEDLNEERVVGSW